VTALLLAALTASPAAAPPVKPLTFDEVNLVPGKNPRTATLRLVLTVPLGDRGDVVARYAGAALREAARHKFAGTDFGGGLPRYDDVGVTFFLRERPGDRFGAYTGFSIEQLREIAAAKPKEARRLAGRHAWAFKKLP
jgi:hypothetical protein